MNPHTPDRRSRLLEILAVEGLPLFSPLATPTDLSPISAVELLEEGLYEDVRSSSKITLSTDRASWIDAEVQRPVIGKVTVTYVPSRLRLRRTALDMALLTFRSRSCTVQALAAVLFGALATLLAPDELKVVVTAGVDGIKDTGEVSKKFVEGGSHVFDAAEELTRVVLSVEVPRLIGELRQRGGPPTQAVTAALDALKQILESRSWSYASDQREALAYSLAVAAFQAGGARAFGLDFYAGDGIESSETPEPAHTSAPPYLPSLSPTPQTDVEEWIEEVMRGEKNTGSLRVTFETGREQPVSVERVPEAASALEELEELGAAELEEASPASSASKPQTCRDALPRLRVWELLRAAGLRCGCLTGSSRWEILSDKLGSHVVGQWAMGYPGLTVELKWLEPWGEEHSRTYPDGATEADVVAWLEPWVERQQREAARPSPDLEEEAGEEAELLEVSGPTYDDNHAAELEASGEAELGGLDGLAAVEAGIMRRAVERCGCTLDLETGRSARCADGFEHFDVHDTEGRVAARICREGASAWFLLDGQKRTPTSPGEVARLLSPEPEPQAAETETQVVEVEPEPAPTPEPQADAPWLDMPDLSTEIRTLFAEIRLKQLRQDAAHLRLQLDDVIQAKRSGGTRCLKITGRGGRILARIEDWGPAAGIDVRRGASGAAENAPTITGALRLIRSALLEG